jgi:hypothetical protein
VGAGFIIHLAILLAGEEVEIRACFSTGQRLQAPKDSHTDNQPLFMKEFCLNERLTEVFRGRKVKFISCFDPTFFGSTNRIPTTEHA